MLSQLKCDKSPRDAAAAASDSPQSVEPQVDAAQTIAAPKRLQKHLAKLREPSSRRSRQKGELLSSGTAHARIEPDQGCVEAAEPSHSFEPPDLMKQPQQVQVRSVSMTVVAATAFEPHVQDEQQQQQGLSGQMDCNDGERRLLTHYDAALQRGCEATAEDLLYPVKTVTEGSVRYWFCKNLRLQAQMRARHMQL